MDSEATAADDAGRVSGGTPAPIGALLGAARVARGLELVDVARDTRVPIRHLAAIEADDHDHLPALPYAIGFVKAFARVVGIDPEMAGARFRGETNKVAHVPLPPALAPIDARRLPPRGVVAASLAALVAVIALVVAWSTGTFDATPVTPIALAPTPPPTAATAPTGSAATRTPDASATGTATQAPARISPSPAVPSAATPLDTGVAPPVAAPAAGVALPPVAGAAGPVIITASEDAWFKVSVFDASAGKVVTVKTGVLARGERYVPPPTPGLRLWTGRAGALQITVDGRAIPALGGPVETVKNVSLDAADLRARLAPSAGSHAAPLPGRAGPPVG